MAVLFEWLAAVLVSLFASFAGNLAKVLLKFSVVSIIFLAFSTMFIAAAYAYLSSLNLLVKGIDQTVPDIVTGVWGWVMPDNTTACFTVILSALHLRFFTKLYFSLMNRRFSAALASKS